MAKRLFGKYPEAFRQKALERMKNCSSVSELAKELGIARTVLYMWKWKAEPEVNYSSRKLKKQIRQMKRVLAEKPLEVDFFKGALQKIEARRKSGGSGETASTTKSGR